MKRGVIWSGRRVAVSALAVFLVATAAPARADSEFPFYAGVMGGYVFTDSALDYKRASSIHGLLGYELQQGLTLEANAFMQPSIRDVDNGTDYAYAGGLDLNLGKRTPMQPFFLVGAGAQYDDFGFAQEESTSPYANLGAGIYLPGFSENILARAEVRWNMVFYSDDLPNGDSSAQNIRLNMGLVFGYAGKEAPPPAPAPAPEPPKPIVDNDGDGIADGVDQCPDTPRWIAATSTGCTPDSDADGITDDKDKCPATPAGVTVNELGCEPPKDADGDGVVDTLDQCPQTAAGVKIDEAGCEVKVDSDGDGVADALDQCPNTPAEFEIDERGCVVVQKVVLTGVTFAVGSDKLTPQAGNVLNSVADSLKRTPGLRIEVAGHTDSTGSQAFNVKLSKRRASAVRDYLIRQGVPADQLTAEGYGPFQPIADNKTKEGQARNRRVEFRVLQK